MPHSSGGGSHGGGFHGGGSHGSSGNHISRTYFPGAHRYLKHHRNGGAADEYVYSRTKPQKTSLFPVIFLSIFAGFFVVMSTLGMSESVPRKLKPRYLDSPAVYDTIDVIKNDDSLLSVLEKYNEITGICPVIYTMYVDDMGSGQIDVEAYTYDLYVNNYSDEQHWVFLYVIPKSDALLLEEGQITVPNYAWEAVQGDETDPIITESMFNRFGNMVQDALEQGYDPGVAFTDAFQYAIKNAGDKLDTGNPSRILALVSTFFPLLIIGGIFTPMLIGAINQYRKDKDVEYEEVPFDAEPVQEQKAVSFGIGASTYTGSSGTSKSWNYTTDKAPKAVQFISFLFLIPFFVAGIGMLVTAVSLLTSSMEDKSFGIMLLIFGIAWLFILTVSTISMISKFIKKPKDSEMPERSGHPTPEYPDAKIPESQPAQPSGIDSTEFDPQFFGTAKSDYESDDEDYKRMKRQGFE